MWWGVAGVEAAAPVTTAPLLGECAPQLVDDLLVWDWHPRARESLHARMSRGMTRDECEDLDDWAQGARPSPMNGRPLERHASARLLSEFLNLHDATPRRFRTFADRWGPLGVCRHGELEWHTPGTWLPCRGFDGVYVRWEPLGAWRQWVHRAVAVMNIGVEIAAGRPGRDADWDGLIPDGSGRYIAQLTRPALEDEGGPVFASRRLLTQQLRVWMGAGRVEVSLGWPGDRPALEFGANTLGGMIALQLVTTLARADELASCAACGRSFLAARRGGRGPRRFCPACGPEAGRRQASRDYYARNKDEIQRKARERYHATRATTPTTPTRTPTGADASDTGRTN